jgi:hypothetical protein
MKKNTAPSPLLAPEYATPTVRERTLAHMKNLLRNSAKMGAGIAFVYGVATQGCKKPFIVDPPPPPPEGSCKNPDFSLVQRALDGKANWVKANRKWAIALNLGFKWGVADLSFMAFKKDEIQASGASIEPMYVPTSGLELVLLPIRGRTEIELNFPVRCEDKLVPLQLKLDLSKPHKKNGDVPVELVK